MREIATRHGLSRHPLYDTHRAMMRRCYDPRHHAYARYGGRGITVDPSWHDVRGFVSWVEANLGPRPAGMTFDRKDNDGNYEPGGVRWATVFQQQANRSDRPPDWVPPAEPTNAEYQRRHYYKRTRGQLPPPRIS